MHEELPLSVAPTREQLIRQVFIDPIRTVVVVDDEFPTIDALLTNLVEKKESTWKEVDINRVQEILTYARSKDRPWLVDIHDAKRIKADAETRIAPYLDHSDLMVLDYHLSGDHSTGEASINILRQLAMNGHHNLVVLYTKGYSGDFRSVVRDIAIALTFPDPDLIALTDRLAKVSDVVADWQDIEPDFEAFILEQITTDVYLQLRRRNRDYKKFLSTTPSKALVDRYKRKPDGIKVNLGDLVEWLCLKRQNQLIGQMSIIDFGPIETGDVGGVFWIRSERLFITVVPKGDSPSVFEERLAKTLTDSFLPPHQILLAKIRSELDEQGSRAEVSILNNRAVQTAWLEEFLRPEPADESSAIHGAVNRHWEALGDSLREGLESFGKQLRAAYLGLDNASLFDMCGLKLSDLDSESTMLAYNHFISTKRFDRSHLTTGHVLRIPSEAEPQSLEYWICLTPACDLVPGQKTLGWNARLGSSLPFNAFRLFSTGAKASVEKATTNNYLFLLVNGKPESFSIYPDGNNSSTPEWEQMLVADQGRFENGQRLRLTRTAVVKESIVAIQTEALVVAQLRSEYALSLLQRVSSFMSRPGLGMHFRSRVKAV
jgi:hypothetical protein